MGAPNAGGVGQNQVLADLFPAGREHFFQVIQVRFVKFSIKKSFNVFFFQLINGTSLASIYQALQLFSASNILLNIYLLPVYK